MTGCCPGPRCKMAADDPRHGTDNGYTNLGCRCDLCRDAHTVQARESRGGEPLRIPRIAYGIAPPLPCSSRGPGGIDWQGVAEFVSDEWGSFDAESERVAARGAKTLRGMGLDAVSRGSYVYFRGDA